MSLAALVPPTTLPSPLCLDLSLQLKAAESLFLGPAEMSEQAGYSSHVSVSRAACLNYSNDQELLHLSQLLHFPYVLCIQECVYVHGSVSGGVTPQSYVTMESDWEKSVRNHFC